MGPLGLSVGRSSVPSSSARQPLGHPRLELHMLRQTYAGTLITRCSTSKGYRCVPVGGAGPLGLSVGMSSLPLSRAKHVFRDERRSAAGAPI